MTKAELTERIIDRITDPWTESPEDYEYADLLDPDSAKDVLKQYREDDVNEGWDEDDRMPDEVTPELFMEVYNCNVRKNRHELQVKRLAAWLTDAEDVCDYDNFRTEYLDDSIDICPTDFLTDSTFPFDTGTNDDLSIIDILDIGARSKHTFNPNHEFCWYDSTKMQLYSSNTPFADGVIDAVSMARYAIDEPNHDCLRDILSSMPPESVQYIFGCTEDELMTGLNMKGE